MTNTPNTGPSHRLRLAVTVRREGGYWLATAGKLDSYGTGDTPATAVESRLASVVARARIFREERASLGGGPFGDLAAWERWCGGGATERSPDLPAGGNAP